MPLGIRLTVVAVVLLIGVGSAMLFRKQTSEAETADKTTPDPLLVRKVPTEAARPATVVRAAEPNAAGGTNAPPDVSVIRNASGRKVVPPPDLDTTFSTPFMPKRPEADEPERLPATGTPPGDKPTHRVRIVVDGDSLKSLAKRYLGDANRFMEIYEANRDVLANPDLLPIGTKLKIPADKPTAKPAEKVDIEQPPARPRMVPISR